MRNRFFLVILGRITFFLIFSFVLVHLLSFLGIFLAIAYPILWLISPQSVPCLLCRGQKEGKRCAFCRQPIRKAEGVAPRSFTSALYNGATILGVSLICLLVVLVEYHLLSGQLAFAPKTVAFVIPSKASYRLEEIFPMKIEITDLKVSINAVQADIGFDAERLEIVDISTEGSFATVFIQKEIDNKIGYARLAGGLPNPGFSGKSGIFGTVYFKGKNPGLAKVEFLPSSLVLANNGRGSNVLRQFGAVYYLVLPERISEKEKEEQKSIIKPAVLGEETSETQLTFYEEEKILGQNHSTPSVRPKSKAEVVNSLLATLVQIDRFILNFWAVGPKVR